MGTYFPQDLDTCGELGWMPACSLSTTIKIYVGQLEACPLTEKLHMQFYVSFDQAVRLSQLKGWLPSAHWEVAKKNQLACERYCTKEDCRVEGPWRLGLNSQGQRTDLAALMQMIKEGASERKVLEEFPSQYFRYRHSIVAAINLHVPHRDFKPEIEIYHGATGTGKTRKAYEDNKESCHIQSARTKWWDGYEGQRVVIVDEFYGQWKYDALLQICDRYPYRVQVKGSSVPLRPLKIIFTSNRAPDTWYQHTIVEFMRRVTRILYFDQDGEVSQTYPAPSAGEASGDAHQASADGIREPTHLATVWDAYPLYAS